MRVLSRDPMLESLGVPAPPESSPPTFMRTVPVRATQEIRLNDRSVEFLHWPPVRRFRLDSRNSPLLPCFGPACSSNLWQSAQAYHTRSTQTRRLLFLFLCLDRLLAVLGRQPCPGRTPVLLRLMPVLLRSTPCLFSFLSLWR